MADTEDAPKVECYYRGKRLDDMTKEELIDAVTEMGGLYSDALQRNIDTIKTFKTMSSFRRAG